MASRPTSSPWRPFSEAFDRRWRAVAALAGVVSVTSTVVPLCYAVKAVRPRGQPRVPRLFHALMCKAMRIKVEEVGAPQPVRVPTLYVCNHWSWVDIPVIGSRLLASFVAKAEVGSMGILGRLANIQRTIYIERERRSQTGQQRNSIVERLREGHSVILFPEGTSGSGASVLPFKSSLFGVVDSPDCPDVVIQPVTISYTHINGLPVNRSNRYKIAWVGDMDFGPHAWELMGLGRIRARLHFHTPVRRSDFASRKELARHCEQAVASGLVRARADAAE